MIVVLSPNAVASKWVNKEVGYWLEERGPERLLFVVAGGEVAWDEATRGLILIVRMRRCRC